MVWYAALGMPRGAESTPLSFSTYKCPPSPSTTPRARNPSRRSSTPPTCSRTSGGTATLIRQFTLRTFLQRHRGTQLGVLWSILLPLTLLSVYTFVFGTIFKTTTFGEHTAQNTLHFASILFCGMAVYSIFAESVIRSPTLILENPNFVKKVVFPVEILPIASLGSALLTGLISIALVILGTLLSTHTLPWTAILLPIILLPLLTLALGLAWFLAALGVFLRDIGNVVSILVGQILFFLTPILYHPKLLKDYEWMSTINPLTAIIDGSRSVLLFGEQPQLASPRDHVRVLARVHATRVRVLYEEQARVWGCAVSVGHQQSTKRKRVHMPDEPSAPRRSAFLPTLVGRVSHPPRPAFPTSPACGSHWIARRSDPDACRNDPSTQKESFRCGEESFHYAKELLRCGEESFRYAKELFHCVVESFRCVEEPFRYAKELFLCVEESFRYAKESFRHAHSRTLHGKQGDRFSVHAPRARSTTPRPRRDFEKVPHQ
jgi:lipopolysaccharide transport system permease protein